MPCLRALFYALTLLVCYHKLTYTVEANADPGHIMTVCDVARYVAGMTMYKRSGGDTPPGAQVLIHGEFLLPDANGFFDFTGLAGVCSSKSKKPFTSGNLTKTHHEPGPGVPPFGHLHIDSPAKLRATPLNIITRPRSTVDGPKHRNRSEKMPRSLVASTLNTFQLHACDGQNIEMKCPRNTIISIQFAQYGRQVPSYQMCPSESPNYQNIAEVNEEDTNCLAPTSLQVLLDLCQDKRMCQISASTTTFLQDPCPTTSKYLEVAYKCRPNEFQTKTACEGEQLVLWCKRSTRIVIYTASFGRTAEGNSNCPDADFSDRECQSKAAVSVALSECQGRKQCVLEAEHHMFGNPCRPGTQKYLTVVFTCVPRKLLKEKARNSGKKRYGTGRRRHNGHINGQASFLPKASTFVYERPETTTTTTEPPDQADDSIYRIKGDNSAQPTTATTDDFKEETVPCHNTTVVISESIQKSDKAIGVFSNWLGALLYIKKHKEKAILYFSLGISLGIIGLLTLIIIKILVQRKRHAKLDLTEPTHSRHVSPSRDATSIEREDSDQDVIEVVRFSPRETLRPSNAGPRSLNNSYYG